MSLKKEKLSIINSDDQLVGSEEKYVVYEKKLPHRVSHAIIISKGAILMQKRSKKCNYCASYWSSSAQGHVRTNESYEAAAKRELKEELAVECTLKYLGKTIYYSDFQKYLGVCIAECNSEPKINTAAVDEVKYVPINDLKKFLNNNRTHPEFGFVIKIVENYLNENTNP